MEAALLAFDLKDREQQKKQLDQLTYWTKITS